MKTINLLKIATALLFSVISYNAVAQQTVKAMIESKNFMFKADNANPMAGRTVQLSPGYDITVSKDRVTAYLPYFGRATSAPIDPTNGGIKFTSQSFVYNVTARKAGGWDITIDLNDVPTVRSMTMVVFDNGTATLDVTSNERDPISFRGQVTSYQVKKTQAK